MSGHIVIPFRTIKKSKREIYGVHYSVCTATFNTTLGDIVDLPLEDGGLSTENSYIIGIEEREWDPDICECNFKQQLILNAIALRNFLIQQPSFYKFYCLSHSKLIQAVSWQFLASRLSCPTVMSLRLQCSLL